MARSYYSIGSSFGWSRLILPGAKDEGSFETNAPYLIKAFNGETKVTQLMEKSCEGLDHTKNYSENIKVLKQGVERGEEAITSPEDLNYPKTKYRLECGWTRRRVMVS
ncbi:hypothetical protein BHM03_00010444 [Ensete ventricosum]|nr:hypothetical protein BHM03_00010444 [Ensete ventricosum]